MCDQFVLSSNVQFCYFCSNETLTDQDIENKFTSLSLAFKTDKLTLTNRLELQQRQRDISEKNIESEISQLKKDIEVNILLFKGKQTADNIAYVNKQLTRMQNCKQIADKKLNCKQTADNTDKL